MSAVVSRPALAAVVLLILAACLCRALPATAQANPFAPSDAPRQEARVENGNGPAAAPSVLAPAMAALARWQAALRRAMADAARAVRDDPLGRAFWTFMALSLAYGVIHALGPGHGKVLAVAYFLNRPGHWVLGLAFGNLTMLCHVLSATGLVYLGKYALQVSAARTVEDMGSVLNAASGGLLLAVGAWLLVRAVVQCRTAPCREDEATEVPADIGSLAAVSLATGMVPCPGAALVLVFAISLDIQAAGLMSMAAITLGMGLTISAFAVAAICCRGGVLRLMRGRGRRLRAGRCGLSLAGSLAIACLGGLLLLGSLAA